MPYEHLRVLVTGTRNYSDAKYLRWVLDTIQPTVVIEGAARGADALASQWANDRDIQNDRYPANWKEYHRAAGPIRNKQMLVEGKPDVVVAFPESGGRGTQNMMRQALKAGLPVIDATKCGGINGCITVGEWCAPRVPHHRQRLDFGDGILRTECSQRETPEGWMLDIDWQTRGGESILNSYGPYRSEDDADNAYMRAEIPPQERNTT